jgi:peptidoglycan pentaglycine glycine transferase (the first glycine)
MESAAGGIEGAVLWRDGPWRLMEASEGASAAFDAFVAGHERCDFLQSWQWGALKALAGWRPHRLALTRDGRVEAVASVLERRLPLALGTLLYAPRGPVLDYADPELLGRFLDAVTEALRPSGAVLLKLDPDVPDDPALARRLRALGLRPGRRRGHFGGIQPRYVMQLALDRDLDAVFASFTAKGRYNVRLARRHGVEVREAAAADLPVVCRLMRETALRDGFGLRSDAYYACVFDHTVGAGHGRVLLASVDGEDVAATWTVQFGHKAWYLYGASSHRHRDKMPNYLLQWEAIRWAHGRGARVYDFLGVPRTPDPQSPIVGLWRFKERFGARPVAFVGEFDLPLRPAGYLLWRACDPVYAHLSVALGRGARAARRLLPPRPALSGGPAPAPDAP